MIRSNTSPSSSISLQQLVKRLEIFIKENRQGNPLTLIELRKTAAVNLDAFATFN